MKINFCVQKMSSAVLASGITGLNGLAGSHGSEEGGCVGKRQFTILELLGSFVILRLPLVVVLDLGGHPDKAQQRGELLYILHQDDVSVLAGQVLGLTH